MIIEQEVKIHAMTMILRVSPLFYSHNLTGTLHCLYFRLMQRCSNSPPCPQIHPPPGDLYEGQVTPLFRILQSFLLTLRMSRHLILPLKAFKIWNQLFLQPPLQSQFTIQPYLGPLHIPMHTCPSV